MKIIFLKHKLTPFPFSPTCPTFSSTSLATRSSTKITAKSPNYQMPSSSSPLALAVWVGILLIILITSIVTGEDLNDQADHLSSPRGEEDGHDANHVPKHILVHEGSEVTLNTWW
jgi:hypothetical protein